MQREMFATRNGYIRYALTAGPLSIDIVHFMVFAVPRDAANTIVPTQGASMSIYTLHRDHFGFPSCIFMK